METLKKKQIVMTGATSGLGKAAARHFLNQGAHLIVLARDRSKVEEFMKELDPSTSRGELHVITCDLNSFQSLKEACIQIHEKYSSIDMLLNNAGVWCFEPSKSEDNIETTLQTNVLAPAFLMESLLPLLKMSADPKIINTASALHFGNIQFEDLEFNTKFSGFHSYRQSKLMLILLTRHYSTLKPYNGILLCSQHPGLVNTSLGRSAGWFARLFFRVFGKSPKKGAETLIYLAETSSKDLLNGAYYANARATNTSTKQSRDSKLGLLVYQTTHVLLSPFLNTPPPPVD